MDMSIVLLKPQEKPANKKSSPKQDLTQEKFAKGRQRKKATQKGHHKALV